MKPYAFSQISIKFDNSAEILEKITFSETNEICIKYKKIIKKTVKTFVKICKKVLMKYLYAIFVKYKRIDDLAKHLEIGYFIKINSIFIKMKKNQKKMKLMK